MYLSLSWSYWITLALAIPTAMLQIRLFIIQHDCGHGAFFRSSRACDILGSVIGVLTLTPYHYWKREHSIHHATSGLLEKRGHGDIDTLTVAEYEARGWLGRFGYRVYRHPLVLFLIGPVYHFIVKHRFPLSTRPHTRAGVVSIWLTNAALAAILLLAHLTIGLKAFLLVQAPITVLSCAAGVWLFYVQHQYRETYWEHKGDWDYVDAALLGSSHYDLGRVLHWFTGNIGFHHVHHLNARIPNYRLKECHGENPELSRVTRLSIWQSLGCARLTLWDEARRKLIRFRERHETTPAGGGGNTNG